MRSSLIWGVFTLFQHFLIFFLFFHLKPKWMAGSTPTLSLWLAGGKKRRILLSLSLTFLFSLGEEQSRRCHSVDGENPST
jgi:hypothetical protein